MKYCARHDHNHNERVCPFCEDESETIGDAVIGEDIFAKEDELCADCGLSYDDCECIFETDEDDFEDLEELDFEDPDRAFRIQDEEDL